MRRRCSEGMNKLTYLSVLPVALLVTACVEEELPAEDPIDEAFLDESGKDDAYGISDKSPEGLGILQLVNRGYYSELQKAGIGQNALREIWNHRDGTDNLASSADDDLFNDLAELDSLPYVGRGAIQKLLAYAQANGYVSPNPFEANACTGSPLTLARLQEVTQNGTAKFPTGATWMRERRCNGALGCSAWSTPAKLAKPIDSNLTYGSSTPNEIGFMARMYSRQTIHSHRYPSYDSISDYYWTFKFTTSPLSLVSSSMFGNAASSGVRINDTQLTATDHCLRLVGNIKLLDASYSPNGIEREIAFMVQY